MDLPGYFNGHLDKVAAWKGFKDLCARAGLKDTDDETYSPHSMRTYAGDAMREAGLHEKYVLLIIGHKSKLAAEASYANWIKAEEQWVEKCSEKTCFLLEKVEIVVSRPDLEARAMIGQLQRDVAKVAQVVEVLMGKDFVRKQLETMSEDERKQLVAKTPQQELEWIASLKAGDPITGEQLHRLSKQTKSWSNHQWEYIQTTIGSDDYIRALTDGYDEFQQNGEVVILRQVTSPVS